MPEKPKNRTKISTPQIREKIITVSFADSINEFLIALSGVPRMIAKTKTTAAPNAPASVGVAQPL